MCRLCNVENEMEPSGRGEQGEELWARFARSVWRRKKWRQTGEAPGRCALCALPFHRAGTYYLRPVYTDGTHWICRACHHALVLRTGQTPVDRYGSR